MREPVQFAEAPRRGMRRCGQTALGVLGGFLCGAFLFGAFVSDEPSGALGEGSELRQAVHMAQMRSATLATEAAAARSHATRLQEENGALGAELARIREVHRTLVASLEAWSARFAAEVQRGVEATGLDLEALVESHRETAKGHRGGPYLPVGTLAQRRLNAGLSPAVAKAFELGSVVQKLPLARPLPGHTGVSSGFGPRSDPFTRRPADHAGLDFPAPRGLAVLATAPGIVVRAGREGDYGNMVEIEHESGLSTRYAHLKSISVETGAMVVAGQDLGTVGSTGRSTGPHLHYEVRLNGEVLDPAAFLAAGERLAALGAAR